MIRVEIKNLEKIQRAFDKYPKLSVNNFGKAINKSIIQVENDAKRNAPVDTGELRSKWSRSFGKLMGRLSPTAKHAIFVHEGTAPHTITIRTKRVLTDGKSFFGTVVNHPGQKAQPFLSDAAESNKDFIDEQFYKALKSTLANIWD